jgi:hypothetical protein
MTYYLRWRANFGVVPLLRFFAFLLAPPFTFFLLLIDSVFFVKETTGQLLVTSRIRSADAHISRFFLPIAVLFVKAFLPLCVMAATDNLSTPKTIILSQGEHQQIPIQGLKHFSVGNPGSVSYRYDAKSRSILIKGKNVGYSEIFVWKQTGAPDRYQVYVLSKKDHLDVAQTAQIFRSIGLEVEVVGTNLKITGIVEKVEDYLLVKKFQKSRPDTLLTLATLHPKARNFIIGKIYSLLYQEDIHDLVCDEDHLNITCTFDKSSPPGEIPLKALTEQYFVDFMPIEQGDNKSNFLATMKVIQIEQLDGREFSLGTSRIEALAKDLFTKGLGTVIENNRILITQNNLELSTLAEPEFILQPNHDSEVEIGQELPYYLKNQPSGANAREVIWKFAGLKVKLKLERSGDKLRLTYQTQCTRAEGEAIGGSKESSIATLTPGQPLQIFKIGIKTTGKSVESLPVLGSIPILGHLFRSSSKQSSFKQIVGFISIIPRES